MYNYRANDGVEMGGRCCLFVVLFDAEGGSEMANGATGEGLLNDERCRDLLVFSRTTPEVFSQVDCGEPCECADRRTWPVREFFNAPLRELACDEIRDRFGAIEINTPEGIRHFLRHLPQCDNWGGYHAGRVDITTEAGIITGEMYGVDSLVPEYREQCCNSADPENPERTVTQSRGTYIGTGQEALEGCSLVATYTIRYLQDTFAGADTSPCESPRWGGWDMHITGVLACPCRE